MRASTISVAPDQARQAALDLYATFIIPLWLVARVCRIEAYHPPLTPISLQRSFLIIDQGHDNFPIARRVDLADKGEITVENAFLDHRIARDLECIMLARTEQRGGNGEVLRTLQSLDRRTGGDPPMERNVD